SHTTLFLYLQFNAFGFLITQPQVTTTFPYTTLFRSYPQSVNRSYAQTEPGEGKRKHVFIRSGITNGRGESLPSKYMFSFSFSRRSEEHTSELQSRFDIVCCLLLEKITEKISKEHT